MAPNVSTRAVVGPKPAANVSPSPVATAATTRAAELMQMVRALREEVEKNFDHVGDTFAEEAKKIHYGEVDHRNIYGEMTPDESAELHEEGIVRCAPLAVQRGCLGSRGKCEVVDVQVARQAPLPRKRGIGQSL